MKFQRRLDLGILGTPDSEEMWQEIIDKIKIVPNMKILNVSFGHCTEAKLMVNKMVDSGLYTKEEAIDSITMIDKHSAFAGQAKWYGFKNIIQQDFLQWKTDMNFDTCLMNPPYQHPTNKRWKLWVSFIKKAEEMTDSQIAVVSPRSWISGSSTELVEARNTISKMQITHYEDVDCFDVAEKIGYFVCEKNSDVNNDKFFEEMKTTSDKIIDKVSGNNYPFVCKLTTLADKDENGSTTVFHTAANRFKSTVQDKEQMFDKVIVNRSGYYIVEVHDKDTIAGRNASALICSSPSEAEIVKENLLLKLCKFVMKETKTSGFNPIQNLPNFDLKIKWTDEELYNHFNLTQEEIDYVERNSK